MMIHRFGIAVGACALVSFASVAGAQPVLQLDVNSLTANAGGAWGGLSHTGAVQLSMNGSSSLNAILIDGVAQPISGSLMDFQGSIDLLNGVVIGGSFTVELASGAMYNVAMIPSGSGSVKMSAGQTGPFTIDGLTMAGAFDNLVAGTQFGGVDVSLWDSFEPLEGSYLLFKLGPNAGGLDNDVDIDIFIIGEPGDMMECKEKEPNDTFDNKNIFTPECDCIQGLLEKRLMPDDQPDTWLVAFNKQDMIIASNDNGSELGNGKASGLWSSDGNGDGWADILIDNGNGTYSLRLGVTGFPDGFDGNFNGLFQNGPHGQMGEFTMYVEFRDALGATIRIDECVRTFKTGSEAFRMNFLAPVGSAEVHINIDNTTGRKVVCKDVDFMRLVGLEPFKPYCITVVSGLDKDCEPTDTLIGWFDKDGGLIFYDDDSGPAPGYSQLCVIADVNGVINIGVTGKGDGNFDGLNDVTGEPHGVCGTYMLKVQRADGEPHPPASPDGACENGELEMVTQGDVNMDGVVNGADLAILLANWGVTIGQ